MLNEERNLPDQGSNPYLSIRDEQDDNFSDTHLNTETIENLDIVIDIKRKTLQFLGLLIRMDKNRVVKKMFNNKRKKELGRPMLDG